MVMDYDQFSQYVKEALAHLYDHVYLQLHPLGEALVIGSDTEAKGMTLHRILLEAVESLRPAPTIPASDPAWRPYFALHLRYVDGLDVLQVAEDLSLSARQLRREHARGVEALTALLWKQAMGAEHPPQQAQRAAAPAETDAESLTSEINRFAGATAVSRATSVDVTLNGVLTTLADLIRRRHARVSVDLPADLPMVTLERVVLRQILLNTVADLLDRGRDGTVELDTELQENQLHLHLRHTGASQQAPSTDDDRMSLASRLVKMQGGALEFSAAPPFSVRITLPIQRAPTVLIVDDNPDVRQLFQRYLGGGAYQTFGATTAAEAFDLAQHERPQAILLDVMMPDQDGWELLQQLKNHPATTGIPVIVCTVLREQALALSLGAADFLAKPVTRQALLATLARYITGSGDAGRPDSP
jgi:CheY-like chemotaxis protein